AKRPQPENIMEPKLDVDSLHFFDDSSSEGKKSTRKKRKSKKEGKKRNLLEKSSRDAHIPNYAEKESQYISLSVGSDAEDSSSKRIHRERKRMTVQTSPQVSRKSRNGFATDDDGKKIDSVVFDTRSEMKRYKERGDILPTKRRSRSKKKQSAVDYRGNDEYNRFYVGVKSRRRVEKMISNPGEFVLYYEKPKDGEMPSSVNLKIAYRSSTSHIYHFVIQSFENSHGHTHYVVMQNKSD
ncbi:hypothetical protein PMAYCL1PPCAC_28656, partial [Pristionchus mayeri]